MFMRAALIAKIATLSGPPTRTKAAQGRRYLDIFLSCAAPAAGQACRW
jgi:hypothetical protein